MIGVESALLVHLAQSRQCTSGLVLYGTAFLEGYLYWMLLVNDEKI